MSKTLFVNGCSFSWGDELRDRRTQAYPKLLCQKLGYGLVNFSECGASNDKILRTTLEFLQKSKDKKDDMFVIVQWSAILRREFYSNGWYKITPSMINSRQVADIWYTLQSQEQDNLIFYFQVSFLQLWLKKHGFKYFMFRKDDGNSPMVIKDGSGDTVTDRYDTRFLNEEQISEINLETFPSFTDNSLSFQEYAYARGGKPKGKLHPDEKSHQIITDYLYGIVRDSE